MKNPFSTGDTREYRTLVTEDKLAVFDAGLVHPVYATFALAKDAEWACRLFVLEMKEEGEEGIGTFLSVNHLEPAPLGSEIRIEATLEEVSGISVICTYRAYAGERLIADGKTTQKIINKAKFDTLIDGLKSASVLK